MSHWRWWSRFLVTFPALIGPEFWIRKHLFCPFRICSMWEVVNPKAGRLEHDHWFCPACWRRKP